MPQRSRHALPTPPDATSRPTTGQARHRAPGDPVTAPPRTLELPTVPAFSSLLPPADRAAAIRHDDEPHGLQTIGSLDVLERWLGGHR